MKFILLLAVLTVAGCSQTQCRRMPETPPGQTKTVTEAASKKIWIYKWDQTRQCAKNGEIALDQMKEELSSQGISVFAQKKGNDGMMRPTVCGAETGHINMYEISESQEKQALGLGFQRVK